MSTAQVKVKIGTEAELGALRSMEAELKKQVVALKAIGGASAELQKVERNLAAVQTRLGGMGRGDKIMGAVGDFFKELPVVGGAMKVLNGSAAAVGVSVSALGIAFQQTLSAMRDASALVETANQLNLTSTAVQSLNAHFGDAGIKAEQWQAVTLKLGQSLAQAAAGSQPLRDAFAALGLDIANLRAMHPDEALAAVGRALDANRGSAAATSASYQILGEQVGRLKTSLIDLGQQGAGEVERAMLAAGRATEDHLNRKLEEAQRKWDALMQRVVNVRNRIAAFAVSPFESYMEPFANAGGLGDLVRRTGADADEQERNRALLRTRKEEEAKTEAEIAAEIAAARLKASQDADAKIAAFRQKLDVDRAAEEQRTENLAQQVSARELAALPVSEQRAQLDERRAQVSAAIAASADDQTITNEQLLKLRLEELDLSEKIAAIDKQKADAAERAAEAERQRALSLKLAASAERIRQIDADPYALNATKDTARLAELREQNRLIAERIALLEREQAASPDPTRQGQIDTLRGQQAGNASQINTLANPQTPQQGAMAGVVQYLNSIPTAAQRAQQALYGIAQAMEQGIATSLRGLIDGTMTWANALSNIANSIVNSIINSFVGMVAQWITQQIVMAVMGNAIRAAQLAALAPVTAATAAMWMPAATAASIATLGGAAVTGATAAQTAVAASRIPLAEGGYVSGPGTGTSDSIAAWLSNGEYVMPADKTARFRPLLDSMRDGELDASAPAASAAGSAGGSSIVINNHFASGVTRAEVAALIPEIERRTIAAIRDRDKRGKA